MIEWLLEADRALAAGRLDDAQRKFEQVAANDARNAIAVVGLARVAMARGNVPTARTLIERALAIDPDNAAARRHAAALPAVRVVSVPAAGDPPPTAGPSPGPPAVPPAGDPVSSDAMTARPGTDPIGTPPGRDMPPDPDPAPSAGGRLLRRLLGRDR